MTTEDLTKKVFEFEGAIKELTSSTKSAHHRVDKLEGEIKDLRDLTVAVTKVADKVGEVSEKVDNIDKRTERLESEPAEDFKHYKRLIIGCIATTIIGAILGAILVLVIK